MVGAFGRAPQPLWRALLTWRVLTHATGGAVGASLIVDGSLGLALGEPGFIGMPALMSAVIGLAILALLIADLRRIGRDREVAVLDPRTGVDMVPPMPHWMKMVLVALPALMIALAVSVGLVLR